VNRYVMPIGRRHCPRSGWTQQPLRWRPIPRRKTSLMLPNNTALAMLINAQQNHTVSRVTGHKELFAAGFPIHALQLVPAAYGDLAWALPSQRDNRDSVLGALEHSNPGTIRRE